jgi:xanthine dehydrogenase molybdopterin-binding subunit B
MEHVAFSLKKDPWEVRMANMMSKGDSIFVNPSSQLEENPLTSMMQQFKKECDFDTRMKNVQQFNKV